MTAVADPRELFTATIESLFDRFRRSRLAPSDFVDSKDANAGLSIAAVDQWVNSKSVMEPDILPFRHLDDPETVILDVGAHLGYTAASFRSLPLRNYIHSFEPMPLYNPMLDRLANLDDKYSYSNTACSDRSTIHEAFNLVINGVLVGGTTTIDGKTFEKWFSDYLASRIGESWLMPHESYDARFLKVSFIAEPLDAIVLNPNSKWKHRGRRIAGLKIDVEGHEHEAIAGSAETLQIHKPLVMVEIIPSEHGQMATRMAAFDYLPYDRHGETLRPTNAPQYNSYFVHRSRLGEYSAVGLVHPL